MYKREAPQKKRTDKSENKKDSKQTSQYNEQGTNDGRKITKRE